LPESIPYVQTTSGARVELGFDKKAVIFEHAYDNTPTNHVPLRSTAVVLTLRANGGINGGTLAVTTSRLSRLGIVDGDRPITGSTNLAPYQVYEMVSTNHGALASTMVNDIEVTAEFMENDSDETVRVHTALTAYELKLSAEYVAPENPTCTNRHIYGVGEKVRFRVMPKSSIVSLHTVLQDMGDETFSYETFDANPTNGVLEVHADLDHVYTCPISKNYQPDIKVQAYDVEYVPIISLVEPSQVITTGAMWGDNAVDIFYVGNVKCWPYGEVGTAALVTTNYIGPMNVSFKGIAVSEVPCEDLDIVSGCFTNTPTEFQSHTRDAGAGRAHNIKDGNFWFVDGARSRSYVHNWTPNSTNSWLIPIGWHRLQYDVNSLGEEYDSHEVYDYDFETRWSESTRRLQVGATSDIIKQVVTIDGDGTCRTEKFGHWISRTRWCRVTLDGTVLQKSHHEQDR